jgi:nucleotide-binding universal stress UspA family protein
MFQRILVPLDGSERAEQAIPVAANIARATHGAVVLLRVAPRPTELYLLSVEASEGTEDVMAAKRGEIKHYLTQLASSEALDGVGTVTEVVDGAPAEAILSVARSRDADLIVMCSHGYTGFKRWVLGSITQKVAWHSTIPVLVIRENGQNLTSLSQNVGHPIRALVALDGTPFTETVMLPAAQLVAACSAPARGKLHLTHLVKLPDETDEVAYERLGIANDLRQAALYHADHYLQTIKERLIHEIPDELAVDITWSVEECEDVAESLLKIAQGEGIGTHTSSDLIALTTHGGSALHRWMMGSVAERVLNSTTMPLLIVHPHKLSLAFASHTSEDEHEVTPE